MHGLGCRPDGAARQLSMTEAVVEDGDTRYDCNQGIEDVRLYWDIEKQAHCCARFGLGCPDNAFDCESGYMNWVHGWSDGKKIWCCQHTNRGCPPTTITETTTRTLTMTTTFPGCKRFCTLQDVKVTCEERIHFASVHTFLGEVSPCQLAHELVLHECEGLCDLCSVSQACLGAANVETTTPAPTTRKHEHSDDGAIAAKPFNCHEGLDMWQVVWFPAKQEWCCKNEQLGCPNTAESEQKWSLRKSTVFAARRPGGPLLVALAGLVAAIPIAWLRWRRQPTGNYEELMAESRLQGEVDDDHDGARRCFQSSDRHFYNSECT
ncbi:Pip5kl1 [Symbiodinium pilosum]|uniref:Pip5kl1 protein n=1 Tax=Symbiodinium pilosum TaxID=2952 RepID=A0A812W4R3_SYMPI|nr:Pip5kl1 [Symbiodinium pilosum]